MNMSFKENLVLLPLNLVFVIIFLHLFGCFLSTGNIIFGFLLKFRWK